MTTIFGVPDNPLADPAHADSVRSKYSPNLFISYPSVQDWRNLYDPHRTRDVRASMASFKDLKHHHQWSVLKLLDRVHSTRAGKAVLAELTAAPHQVFVFPYDFISARFMRPQITAATGGLTGEDDFRTFARGTHLCFRHQDGHAACVSAPGGGGRVAVYFEALRATGLESADDVLLHELVHATRQMRGLRNRFPVTGSYKNAEEFYATLITQIHRAEKGNPPVEYGGQPMSNPKVFLDAGVSPSLRTLIATMRSEQKTLFEALAKIPASFNPVRDVDLETKAYIAKIESMPV